MADTYTITGSLLDAQTDAPLVGLVVEAHATEDDQGQRRGSTLTDANGAFDLTVRTASGEEVPELRLTIYINGRSDVAHRTDAFRPTDPPHDLGRIRIIPRRMQRAVPAYIEALGHALPSASAPSAPAAPFESRFPELTPHRPPDEVLEHLGQPDGPMSERRSLWADDSYDSPNLPAGYTFFVQFLCHDLTYELTRRLGTERPPNVKGGPSYMRLHSLYGPGPEMAPHLYAFDNRDRFSGRLLAGASGTPQDLPRNRQGRALIADPRNDENVVLAQLHLGLLHFHNAVADHLDTGTIDGMRLFARTQQQVRWHYQWAIVHDLLPRLVGPEAVEAALERPLSGTPPTDGLPLEVAQGVLRYVYSQVRLEYQINDEETVTLLPEPEGPQALVRQSATPIPSHLAVDWSRFFELDGPPQSSKLIDTKIAPAFLDLPLVDDPRPARRSVAARFLLQGKAVGLPSGEAVAQALGEPAALSTTSALRRLGLEATPLLYYVLAEAEHQYEDTGVDRLGPVGSRLLTDALIRRLRLDPRSYLNANPDFTPLDAATDEDGTFAVGTLVTAGTA